jgi:hypothetical protein
LKLYVGQLVEVEGLLLDDDTCPLGRIVEMDSMNPSIFSFYEKVEMLGGNKYYVFRDSLIPKVEAGPGLEINP